ncbi:MAG: hypothetical protein GC183_15925 [Thiobacillus sp.]|nr:hypothetical protein [Thiobacillus sp.]
MGRMQGATAGQIRRQFDLKAGRIPRFILDARAHRMACLHDFEAEGDKLLLFAVGTAGIDGPRRAQNEKG